MLNKEMYMCRVCGLQQDDPPWGEDGNTPSFEICDCCGTEFGYHDATPQAVSNTRREWLSENVQWFNPKAKPEHWILENQLQQISSQSQ